MTTVPPDRSLDHTSSFSTADVIIERLQECLADSPSDFSITILPLTTTEQQHNDESLYKPSLDYSIVNVEGHLGLDARSLPWITRELRSAYKQLRVERNININKSNNHHRHENDDSSTNWTLWRTVTTCLLLVNPDHSTVWADRRRAILGMTEPTTTTTTTITTTAEPDSSNNRKTFDVWKDELTYLDLLFTQHSKAPSSWAHRKFCLRQILKLVGSSRDDALDKRAFLELIQGEQDACERVAESFPKNYYAWTHRRYLWTLLSKFADDDNINNTDSEHNSDPWTILLEDEMDRLWKWLHLHPSDHSAVHYMGQIMDLYLSSKCTTDSVAGVGIPDQIQGRVRELIGDHGEHESIWILRRITNATLWKHQFCNYVVEDLRLVMIDLKEPSLMINCETETTHQYRLALVAWCVASLHGVMGEGLALSPDELSMILIKLSQSSRQTCQMWKICGKRLLGLPQ